jgi:hypothetical protein
MQLAIIRESTGTIVRMPLPSKLRAKYEKQINGTICPYFVKLCQEWIAENEPPGWFIFEILEEKNAIPLDKC